MGTRSITFFRDDEFFDGNICAMYRQYDGYLDGHGMDLKEFLSGKEIVNGMNRRQEAGKVFNGIGCLAASTIKHFKDGPGGIYIYPPDAGPEEYSYTVYNRKDDRSEIMLKVEGHGKLLYDGPVDGFYPEACQEGDE